MMGRRACAAVVLAALLVCRVAGATGLMIPEDRQLPPLAIQSHRVEVTIDGAVARTRATEVFLNSTDRRLEATFIFPVPKDAALTDFAMWINGKRMSGEVLPADEARQVYTDIVRRLRDPGLLEYLDSGLLRMRVFPIEPKSTTRVEVTYSHTLPFDNGVYEYTYPLKVGTKASRVLEDFTLSVDLTSRQPIKSIYCPTHKVGISRKDDHHAIVGFEQMGAALDTDFTLFYTVSDKDFGLNLLTYRLENEDGYFALMLSPRVEMPEAKVMAKDVAFVIDVSGSMQQQNRIASARQAVQFCLKALNPGDRFAILPFSTTVESYAEELQEGTPENVKKALEYVQGLEASGGTALCDAVLKALDMAPDGERPYLVVLVTDGKPTIRVTDPDDIIKEVQAANQANIRIFPFGIAENLDVPLLDRLAETSHGYSDYVAPGSDIEVKISGFFSKVSYPVMSNLELDFGGIKVSDVYPPKLPDLFRGSQVVAFGRYSGEGDVALRLTGTVQGERREFVYDATFPKIAQDNDFLPALWARRKIAYLLDQIRLHGRTEELVDEVVRLSRQYGIATPFTSYLVLPDSERRGAGLTQAEVQVEEARRPLLGAMVRSTDAPASAPAASRRRFAPSMSPAQSAVAQSKQLRALREADAVDEDVKDVPVRRVAGKTFDLTDDGWIDQDYRPEMPALKIKWGSDAYFAVLDALPQITDYLALGEKVTVVLDGKALIVGEEGIEQMTADQIREFFGK